MPSVYATLPTLETIDLSELAQIRDIADKMVHIYELHERLGDFSFRILLPREDKQSGKAKRLGFSLQGEFIMGLRKRHIIPKVRDVRYLHDASHYGWILGSPRFFEQLEQS